MQEFEDQDTCRICSAPAEPDQPLFHPCKCSGTIRYIHQDCLTTWLAHSKKKSCDVCKHPYSFTKVYAPDMPSSLPPLLLVRRLVQHIFMALLFVLRAFAVGTIWLGVLPWVTVWTWRMYFSMGESTAWWISDRPKPPSNETPLFYNKLRYEPPVQPPKGLFARITSHPVWLALSADIFTGQIIASLIVLTFVAVFLLREWISQNARPGVFEDEEPLPEDPQPVAPLAAPQPNPIPPPGLPPARLVFPHPHQRRPLPPLPPVPPQAPAANAQQRMDALLAMEVAQADLPPFNAAAAANPDRWGADDNEDAQNRRPRKKKNKARQSDEEEGDTPRPRRKADADEDAKRKMFHRRIHLARTTAARRRVFTKRAASASPSPPLAPKNATDSISSTTEPKFDFTFKAPGFDFGAAGSSSSLPGPSRSLQIDLSSSTRSLPANSSATFLPSQSSSTSSSSKQWDDAPAFGDSPFPTVALQPPSGDIPFSLRPWQPSPPPGDPLPPPPPYPARPPLPTVTLPRSGSASPFLYTPGRTPLDSPSLSTYRPPEDLAAELAARSSGYFDHEDLDELRHGGDSGAGSETNDGLAGKGKGKVNGQPAEGRVCVDCGKPEHKARCVEEEGDLSDMDDEDIQAEHEHYFGDDPDPKPRMRHGTPRPASIPPLEPLTDSDSGETEDEEDQVAPGEMIDDEDGQDELFGFDDDAAWDEAQEEEDDGDEDEANEVVQPEVPVQVPGAGNQPLDDDAAANADLNDEGDGNVEDDMEGAMEAIGMRGPIFGVFQNAALMIFVLDTAIGLCIWIPFTIGKTTALLTLDPQRMLQVLHLPIRAMRLITDPIVDLVAFLILDLIVPKTLAALTFCLRIFMFFGTSSVGKLVGNDKSSSFSDFSSRLINQSNELLQMPLDYLSSWSTPSKVTEGADIITKSTSIIDTIPDHLGPMEPYFVALGSEVREVATVAQMTWIRLALGTGPANRAFAIFLGYMVVAFIFCLYLNVLTVGNAKTAGAAVRNAVRQQLLVLKVAAFIFIELVLFPLGCGIVLDLCTVWLFPEANMQSRVAFFGQAPLTAMFYHWVAGTMFMYTFAVLLSGCRSVMRPGAMWFIKDPQDQNSHPIRDILDRPTLVQLRKIFISGLMYSFVVACVVGSVAGLFFMGHRSIMPFRWKNREPLSNVPVDLLFLHLVLPYTVHYFRPKRVIKEVATIVWKFLATRLRLTSYFFGGRHAQEEFTPKAWRYNLIRDETFVDDPSVVLDGTFRRVPATDNLALPRDMRATVPVTADGEPVDEAAAKLMALQNAEAEKGKRNVKDDYMVVYIPPHFRWRIIAFITCLWYVGAVLVGFAVAIPLSLGRSFFRLFTPRDVHDGYSFIIGFYLIWVCYLTARAIDRLDRRRKRRTNVDGPRAELGLLVVKRGLLWIAKMAYMTFFLGVVVPVLLAMVIDLYIVLPIRFSVNPGMVPKIRIVDQWALGLLYAKIGIYVQRIQPPNRIARGLQHIMLLGWTRPDPILATKEVIAPLVGGLLGMIIIPGGLFRAVQHYLPSAILDNRFIFMHVYPSVFVIAGTFRSAITLYGILSAWSAAIRDKEFLVEMRLRNHEPKPEGKGEEGDVTPIEAGVDGGGAAVARPIPPPGALFMQNAHHENEEVD